MKIRTLCMLAVVLTAWQRVSPPSPAAAAASAAAAPAATSATATAPVATTLFDGVSIESHPAGFGTAHKTVTPDGVIKGAHMSGGPGAVSVYESQDKVSAEDMAALRRLVAAILAQEPAPSEFFDAKGEGYVSVIIIGNGGRAFHAKGGEKFQSADVQALSAR